MTDSLENYNLTEDDTRECPYPYLKAIREQKGVYFMPEIGAYYVSKYEDLRFVKKNPQLFSNDIYTHGKRTGTQRNIAEQYRADNGWARVSTLQRTDPPRHSSYRVLINHAFTVSRVRSMTQYIETVVNDLIDDLITHHSAHGEVDFVSQFAIPLPCIVIADQLGVPRDRIWDLKRWSDAMLAPGGGFIDDKEALECGKQVVQAQQFFAQVITDRRATPKDDIISDLVHAEFKDPQSGELRKLDMYELMDLLDQLLTGGNETTTNALGSALMLLLKSPQDLDKLADDAHLIRNFIEEALRLETPVLHLWRAATQDTEIGGVHIPKGSSIALGYASANRDENVFDNSELLDIERKKAGAHLAFGSGPHHCPGAALARQELYSTFIILLQRIKNIRTVNPNEPFHHIPHGFLRGLKEMKLTFDIKQDERYLPGASAY